MRPCWRVFASLYVVSCEICRQSFLAYFAIARRSSDMRVYNRHGDYGNCWQLTNRTNSCQKPARFTCCDSGVTQSVTSPVHVVYEHQLNHVTFLQHASTAIKAARSASVRVCSCSIILLLTTIFSVLLLWRKCMPPTYAPSCRH